MAVKTRRSPSHASIPPSPPDPQTPALVAEGDPAANADANVDADADAVPEAPIPRPPNAWILYRSEKVRELEALAGSSRRRPQAEISKEIAVMWKDELPEVKAAWEALAELKKAQHKAMYPDYRFQPKKKEVKQQQRQAAKAAKAQKAKASKEAGGCKRTKTRRVTSSPKAERSPKSPTPGLDAKFLPPSFTMGPPEGVSLGDMLGFNTAFPSSTFSSAATHALMPQEQSSAPVASTSQLRTYDLSGGLDAGANGDWPSFSWPQDGLFAAGNSEFFNFELPGNSVLAAPSEAPTPLGWQPGGQDTLGSHAHPATQEVMTIGASDDIGFYYCDPAPDFDPSSEFNLNSGDFFDKFARDEVFAGSFLDVMHSAESAGSGSQRPETHDSPASQPTPALTCPTPAAPLDYAPAWNMSPSHSDTSTGPSTPTFFPRHSDNSVYVPPTGAAIVGTRRVAGSWPHAINAR